LPKIVPVIDEIYLNNTIVNALQGQTIVLVPPRHTLHTQRLIYPVCARNAAPQTNDKRFAAAGAKLTPSSTRPPRTRVLPPSVTAKQNLLRGLRHSGSSFLVILYDNISNDDTKKASRKKALKFKAIDRCARGEYRPFQYNYHLNNNMSKKASQYTCWGEQLIRFTCLIENSGNKQLKVNRILDWHLVHKDVAQQCAQDGSWTNPASGQQHPPLTPADGSPQLALKAFHARAQCAVQSPAISPPTALSTVVEGSAEVHADGCAETSPLKRASIPPQRYQAGPASAKCTGDEIPTAPRKKVKDRKGAQQNEALEYEIGAIVDVRRTDAGTAHADVEIEYFAT
jgi:hypothetical protein